MPHIDPQIVESVLAARRPDELYPHLQGAVQLEHATIPPYLTAMLTLKPVNSHIADLIRSIVIEEMLHMTIAANLLISIGGKPAINTNGFVPSYPGPLPFEVGGPGFIVSIAPFSKLLVKTIFMHIEEPEEPIHIDKLEAATYKTIGAFYVAIKAKLHELVEELGTDQVFVQNPEVQVLQGFGSELLFPIVDLDSACAAIDIILTQGEGSPTSPFESGTDPAHFYKFDEIVQGRGIIEKPDGGFAFEGDEIPFDPAGVYAMPSNVSLTTYPADSPAAIAVTRFASIYTKLLNSLHEAFNGSPGVIMSAIGLMYGLRLEGLKVLETPDGQAGFAGLCFEHVDTTDLFSIG